MTQYAAIILGLSLVVTGVCLVGDALKLWDLPSDIWGAVIVLLGAAGRFVIQAMAKKKKDDDDDAPPPPSPKNAAIIAFVLMFVASGCGANLGAAAAWARCAGGAALACVAQAQGPAPQAALAYSGCVVGQAIDCAAPLVARSNPPRASMSLVDEACAAAVAAECYPLAALEVPPSSHYKSIECVEAKIAACGLAIQ